MSGRLCAICEANPVVAKDRCMTCYQYRRRNGVDRPEGIARRQAELNYRHDQRRQERRNTARLEAERRFLAKVDRTDDCWLWTGFVAPNGYGKCSSRHISNSALVHRVAYEMWIGSIPDGMTIDHLCGERRCVRPDHLEAVTLAENVRRARAARRTA